MAMIKRALQVGALVALALAETGLAAAAEAAAGPAASQSVSIAAPVPGRTFIGEARSSVSAREAYAFAEADARNQATAAGLSDCKVTDYYTLLENYPGFPPSWYANVTLTCAG